MAKAQDFSAMFKDMMGAFPVDTKVMEDAFKNSASMSEKMSAVALDAAEKSTEISSKWTKSTLAKVSELSKAKAEPADYTKAMTDFASFSAETAAENMAAFAEIAASGRNDCSDSSASCCRLPALSGQTSPNAAPKPPPPPRP